MRPEKKGIQGQFRYTKGIVGQRNKIPYLMVSSKAGIDAPLNNCVDTLGNRYSILTSKCFRYYSRFCCMYSHRA